MRALIVEYARRGLIDPGLLNLLKAGEAEAAEAGEAGKDGTAGKAGKGGHGAAALAPAPAGIRPRLRPAGTLAARGGGAGLGGSGGGCF